MDIHLPWLCLCSFCILSESERGIPSQLYNLMPSTEMCLLHLTQTPLNQRGAGATFPFNFFYTGYSTLDMQKVSLINEELHTNYCSKNIIAVYFIINTTSLVHELINSSFADVLTVFVFSFPGFPLVPASIHAVARKKYFDDK